MKIQKEDLKKLQLLITIIPQGKREVIIDLLEEYDTNFSFSVNGRGTSTDDIVEMLGLNNNERDIIFSFIRSEKVNDAILAIEDKFKKFKVNQSIAFSVPVENIIGMQNYLFLSNLGGKNLGK